MGPEFVQRIDKLPYRFLRSLGSPFNTVRAGASARAGLLDALSKLLRTTVDDIRKGIMQGRVPLSEGDDVIKSRREEAGDRIRAEFEQAWETRTA